MYVLLQENASVKKTTGGIADDNGSEQGTCLTNQECCCATGECKTFTELTASTGSTVSACAANLC